MTRRFTTQGGFVNESPTPSDALERAFGLLAGRVLWVDPEGTSGSRRFDGGSFEVGGGVEEWRLDDGEVITHPADGGGIGDGARVAFPSGLVVLVTSAGTRFSRVSPFGRASIPWDELSAWAGQSRLPTVATRIWLKNGLVAWITPQPLLLRIEVRERVNTPNEAIRLIFAPDPTAALVAAVRAAGAVWAAGSVGLIAGVGVDGPGRLALAVLLWSVACVLAGAAAYARLHAAERPRLEVDVDRGRWVGPWRVTSFEWIDIVATERIGAEISRPRGGILVLRRRSGGTIRIPLRALGRGDDAAKLIEQLVNPRPIAQLAGAKGP